MGLSQFSQNWLFKNTKENKIYKILSFFPNLVSVLFILSGVPTLELYLMLDSIAPEDKRGTGY
jgi:hypothetical protein